MGPTARRPALLAFLAVLTAFVVPVAECQQYNPPGSLTELQLPRRQGIEKSLAEARWRLGPVRIDPWIALENLTYVNDVFSGGGGEEVSDLTATVGAGLRAFLPVGQDTMLAAYALPQYVWWQDQEDRRQLVGRYGGGVFAYFNRLILEGVIASEEEQRFATSELTQLVVAKRESAEAVAEVRLVRSLWLTALGSDSSLRYRVDEIDDPRFPAFDRLDRDETLIRLGARVRLAGAWDVGAGIESLETEFVNPGFDRSASGDSPYLSVRRSEDERKVEVELVARSLDPEPGSDFVPFDELVGSAVWIQPLSARLALQVYASRRLSYSITDAYSHALDDRTGLGLAWELGRRTVLSASAEVGTSRYERVLDTTAPERDDDVTGFGARLGFEVWRDVALGIGFTRTEFDSNLPAFDRTIDQLTTTIDLGGFDWP